MKLPILVLCFLTCLPAGADAISLPLEEAPVEAHRLAARCLEERRFEPDVAPGWRDAALAPVVHVFHRPDLEGPAFFEFEVLAEGRPAGSILVSSGRHDAPIVHWSDRGPSLARRLLDASREAGREVERLYRLDAASFVALGRGGEAAATIGSLPFRLEGIDPALYGQEDLLVETRVALPCEAGSDEEAGGEFRSETQGPEAIRFRVADWTSLAELLDGFGSHYAVQLDAARRAASRDWEIEDLAREFGEGLLPGERHRIPILFAGTRFDVEGGAGDFEVRLDETAGAPALEVLAASGREGGADISISLAHPNGVRERIFLFTIPIGAGMAPGPSGADTVPTGPGWATTEHRSAGPLGEQPEYDQWQTSTCQIGCGPVAWAMLFGWADRQAGLGNPYWAPRWGLYRQGGGRGADAVAPIAMDAGVRNAIGELAGHLGTFCVGRAGATMHWDMARASRYLQGRTGTSLYSAYTPLCWTSDRLRDSVIESIRSRNTPAIVGIGFLANGHYPMAWEYRLRQRRVRHSFLFWSWESVEDSREFHLNQGWGGVHSWAPASTWYSGQIAP